MSVELENWVCEHIKDLLGIHEVRDISRRLITLGARSLTQAREYAEDLLGNDPSVVEFFEQFTAKLHSLQLGSSSFVNKASDPARAKGRGLTIKYETTSNASGKKEGKSRFKCGCFGVDHEVGCIICTVCGRIHCGLEGEGPCFFCGSGVFRSGCVPSKEFLDKRKEIAQRANKSVPSEIKEEKQDDLELLIAKGLEKAVIQKNKLVGLSQGNLRNRVIDDQEDFYDFDDVGANPWLDDGERDEMLEKAAENEERLLETAYTYRGPVKISLDFEKVRVVQEADERTVEYKMSEIRSDPLEKLSRAEEASKKNNSNDIITRSSLNSKEEELYKKMMATIQNRKKKS